jgi:hypothetical protein
MKPILALAIFSTAVVSTASSAVVLDILFVAGTSTGTNDAGYQTFATTGQFAGSTWTARGSGTTGNETIGGDLDRVAVFGGTSQSLKSYVESFDLVIVSVPVSSTNFADGANGADWASITVPILFNSALAGRASGGRVGLTSGDNVVSGYAFSSSDETTKVSNSALGNAIFAGVSSTTNLYALATGDIVTTASTAGTGEVISTLTNGTTTAYSIVYWPSGSTDANGRTLADNRAVFALKGGFSDLTADGGIVLGNVINQLAIPEPSAALLGGIGSFLLLRRRRASILPQ